MLKGGTFTNSGSMKVIMEIPYAEVDAFLPCRKAFEIELLATFRRRPTATST